MDAPALKINRRGHSEQTFLSLFAPVQSRGWMLLWWANEWEFQADVKKFQFESNRLADGFKQSLGVRHTNREQVSVVKADQEPVFGDVQQMVVGTDQNRNRCETRLGQDQSIVVFLRRQQTGVYKISGKGLC